MTSIEVGTAVAHKVSLVLEEALDIADSSQNKNNNTNIATTLIDAGLLRWLVLIVRAVLQRFLQK